MAEMVRKAMVYLGLVDDEYDDYEPYDDSQPMAAPYQQSGQYQQGQPAYAPSVPQAASASQPATSRAGSPRSSYPEEGQGLGTIRTIPRETSDVTVSRPSIVRPIVPTVTATAKVHVVEPTGFGDAQEIGDCLKDNQPVIVTLQAVTPELSRRLIDFCSGATYALGGTMERVAKNVFLLTPSNVEVSAEERRRLQERGLYRP